MISFDRTPEGGKYKFDDLYEVIRLLRSPGGCPWDRVQTHRTLITPMVEEAYELVDAIEKESDDKLVEELGDVLL
ncbi:MAG: MazG family protein, partial [Clostridia bacterium]|nr:MazG family protein [Clostridia bacterium]